MNCACCRRDNPPGHTFCHGCGAPMDIRDIRDTRDARASRPTQVVPSGAVNCPECGASHTPGPQFCRACGRDTHAGDSGQLARIGPPVRVSSIVLAPCAECGAAGEHGARFCKFCGAAHAPGRKPASSGAAHVPRADMASAVAQLVVLHRDGSDGTVFPISSDRVDIGGREGDIVLREDPYLSPRHARIERRDASFILLDLGSTNGIYVRLREPETLADGDMILIGQQVLRFEISSEAERQVGPATQHGVMVFGTPEQPRQGRLTQYTTEGLARDVYYLHCAETVLGREAADLTFSDDPFLSRRHAAVVLHPGDRSFVLRDLGSSNGTALRCRVERVLRTGDQFRLGRHLFRFDLVAREQEGQSRS